MLNFHKSFLNNLHRRFEINQSRLINVSRIYRVKSESSVTNTHLFGYELCPIEKPYFFRIVVDTF